MIEDAWYYFDTENFAGAEGTHPANKFMFTTREVYYTFVNGKLTSGSWVVVENGGVRYYYGPDYYRKSWRNIDGKDYYFDTEGLRVTGIYCLKGNAAFGGNATNTWYEFNADGSLIGEVTGIVSDSENLYYVENGILFYKGLFEDNGDIYYADENGRIVTGVYDVKKNNGILPQGAYAFGADGKLISREPLKSGVVKDEDGEIRYYVNGEATYAGVVQDAEGNLYYINSSLKAVKNRVYTIYSHMTNGLIEAGTYAFDAEGKLIR
jgi:glucan-binding YG repeat protein